ncbi:branched-chain amino acid transporter [Rhodococcus sp. WMMA185]|uniref:AzlD domain-containing protein n=1 Tax=Rhodococcus sp. WMMA185 TaxID=679318 RepID=UPI0008787A43|nr:AzlD domain-containing protein [Rhodococcus sp. WMMA185]AOW94613.1 branched-chain amino acid transporter [Rhodococcus sp. WMMA185]
MNSALVLIGAVGALAAGTYAFRFAGPILQPRLAVRPGLEKLMAAAAVVLLTSLVGTTALMEGHGPAGVARPAGVLVAGILAWRRAPFVVVVLSAAATAAGLRLLGVP